MGRSSPARGPSPRGSAQAARGPSPIGSVGAGSSTGAGSEGTGNNWLEDDWDSSDDEGDRQQQGGTVRVVDGGKPGLGAEVSRPSSSMKQDVLGNGSRDGVKQFGRSPSTSSGLAHAACVDDVESDGDASDDNWDSDGGSEDEESPVKSQLRSQLKPQPKATVPASPAGSSQSSAAAGFSGMKPQGGNEEEQHKEVKHDAFVEDDWDDDSDD